MAQAATAKQPKVKVMKSAKQTVDRFDSSWNYAKQNHHIRWRRNWKLYNNKRVLVSYKGITNTFIPLSFSTVETITAALCAGRPSIEFQPQDMYKYIASYYKHGTPPDLKALNAQFDFFWESDNWDLKTIKTVRSGLIYGTACEWVYWDGDKPRILNMNVRDVIIDPKLTDPMQLITNPDDFFSGRRYLTSLETLKSEEILDPDTGQMKKRFKNLDKIVPGIVSGDPTDKEYKEMNLGALSDDKDSVEVIEVWDGQTIKSIAQRTVTIESRPNTLGIHALVIHRFIADESIIYGKAILDPIAQPQEYLNDVTNQRMDAVTDALNPQATLDPVYASWIPKLKNLPSSVYPFKPNSMQYLVKPTVPVAAFTETQNIKQDIRETTAADQVINGAQESGDPTATEINAQVSQAGERFEIYIRMLEREGLYQRAKIVYKMMLKYAPDKNLVPVNSSDGPKFRKLNPEQFDDSYEPQIRLEANVKSAKLAQATQATQSYQIMIADPSNDLWQAKKIMYPKMFDLSEEELDKIIGSQPPQQPQGMPSGAPAPGAAGTAMPGAPGPGGAAPSGQPKEILSLSDIYKATQDPGIKSQIETIAGLQPSTTPPPDQSQPADAPAPQLPQPTGVPA
jgi:hypothetical protein